MRIISQRKTFHLQPSVQPFPLKTWLFVSTTGCLPLLLDPFKDSPFGKNLPRLMFPLINLKPNHPQLRNKVSSYSQALSTLSCREFHRAVCGKGRILKSSYDSFSASQNHSVYCSPLGCLLPLKRPSACSEVTPFHSIVLASRRSDFHVSYPL